jgi:hypothetical protein
MNKPILRFWWEWRARGPFWPDNDEAREAFGIGEIDAADLGLSPSLITELEATAAWHDNALNWTYPPDPGPWRQEECDRFNATSRALFEKCQKVFAGRIELKYVQRDYYEDPDLDAYLADPKNFIRKEA